MTCIFEGRVRGIFCGGCKNLNSCKFSASIYFLVAVLTFLLWWVVYSILWLLSLVDISASLHVSGCSLLKKMLGHSTATLHEALCLTVAWMDFTLHSIFKQCGKVFISPVFRHETWCTGNISQHTAWEASNDVQRYIEQGNSPSLQEIHARCNSSPISTIYYIVWGSHWSKFVSSTENRHQRRFLWAFYLGEFMRCAPQSGNSETCRSIRRPQS